MRSSTTYIPTSPVNLALGAILSLFLISSCSDPATVGIELAPGNNQIGVVFEEFELSAEVVLMDSFNTTNQIVLVVGEEQDDFFGKTSGKGYTRLSFDTQATLPEEDALLDSVFFYLNIRSIDGSNLDKGKYYSVHKLTEQILDTIYYNTDELNYEASPIASGEIVFGEKTDTLVSFKVAPDFAKELFAEMKAGLYFDNVFTFRDYFPGVVIKGREGDNASIGVGLGSGTGILTYYHYEGDTASKGYGITASIRLSDGSIAAARGFSGIDSDRSGTPTQVVTEVKKAYNVGPLVGMKSGLGMVIKLDTSPFDTFLDSLSGITFNQVVLELGELEPQPSTQVPPLGLTMYFTDDKNQILKTSTGAPLTVQTDGSVQVYTNEDGVEIPNTISPTALIYDSEDKIYSQYITSYVNALFRGQLTRKDWLLYGDLPATNGDDFKKSLRQFVVDKNKIKVKVIYSKSR
ncbi:uncharacterized protein DUF4270 [Algoriphagus ratkowskyi]|uniref:DUF4270 domain-containing protein n=1 Tax=Algoriphagus ratkowskyi TaxID=57028 RepID=A0A2W7RUX1_9BACT|nr:DUF4270 family protein [Algoriphagus ratkowskyi]PZX58439.1 uncharacterized protein DUF4270 [Algoriphagus ratkowskyi]TXD77694.1 DUF4270 domain-containing protein [Algoriphagus ratkowskyi]